MSKPKYMKGDCIRSLDDLVLQENIYWNGRIWNRKWFMNLQIQVLLSLIKHKALIQPQNLRSTARTAGILRCAK